MNYLRHIIAAGLTLGLLAGCSSGTVKQTLGLNRGTPDEFRVVSRPPLSVPPQFNLRPPSATDLGPGQLPASGQAKSLVLGDPGSVPADTAAVPVAHKPLKSGGKAESQFLQNAGATGADPHIRDQLMEDRIGAQQPEDDDSSWWNVFSDSRQKKETVVNAQAEKDRIKKNEESGQPVTDGETPTVKEKDTGVLGRILGY